MDETQKPASGTTANVGRGHPPKHTQFRKGTSGNLKGRPKGSKNLSTLLTEAADDRVSATIAGKARNISKLQATAMQLATKAASGDLAAINKFIALMDEIESRAAAAKPSQFPLSEANMEVIQETYERMKKCVSEGAE
jgi:hypothetical protein